MKVLINKYAKNAVNERFLYTYEKKVLAIDVSIYLYKYIYLNGEPLQLLVKQIMRLLKNKVIPLYVFDGKPPKEKNDVLDERYLRKQELINRRDKIKEILDHQEEEDINQNEDDEFSVMTENELREELSNVTKKIIIVNGKVISDCKRLFDLMGVPYIVAQGEAETLCAKLIKEGKVYGCLSEDTDILANGGRYFIRNFNVNNNRIVEYDLIEVLKGLELTYEQFIDVCILCGCDYTCTIKNIGIEKAYQFIKKYGTIEKVIEYVNVENKKCLEKNKNARYVIPENFDYLKARELFVKCGENEDCNINAKLKSPRLNETLAYLKGILRPMVINDLCRNLVRYSEALMIKEMKETTLDQFYSVA